MKRWIGFSFLMTLMSVITMGSSCRHLAEPTFPATNTFTPTPTLNLPTNTPTKTFTFTPSGTPTKTATLTVTNTPGSPTSTPTITNTPTITPTFTITNTPTATATPTITNTPGGATATPTACSPVVQLTYTFDTDNQCWALDGSIPGETVGYSTAVYHTNPGSWEGYIPFLSAGSTVTQEEASISFPCGTFENLTGASVTMWVYSTVAGLNAQMFCNFGTSPSACYTYYENPGYNSSSATGQTGNYAGGIPADTWTMLNFNPVFPTGDGQYVSKFGVNILGGASPATVYIDDVSITLPVGATATPTSTPTPVATWNFDDQTDDSWVPGYGVVAGAVTSIVSPGFSGSGTDYCYNFNATFVSGASVAIQQGFVSPLNLTGGGISCEMWIDSSCASGGNPYGQIFPTDNSGNVSYSYSYNLTPGAWTKLNLTAANFGSVNAGAVTQIVIQGSVNTNETTYGTGNIKIDDIVAY